MSPSRQIIAKSDNMFLWVGRVPMSSKSDVAKRDCSADINSDVIKMAANAISNHYQFAIWNQGYLSFILSDFNLIAFYRKAIYRSLNNVPILLALKLTVWPPSWKICAIWLHFNGKLYKTWFLSFYLSDYHLDSLAV